MNPVLLGALIYALGSSRPLLLLAIGAFFVADAAWYLLRGEPLVAL